MSKSLLQSLILILAITIVLSIAIFLLLYLPLFLPFLPVIFLLMLPITITSNPLLLIILSLISGTVCACLAAFYHEELQACADLLLYPLIQMFDDGKDNLLKSATETGQILYLIPAMVSSWLFRSFINLSAMFKTYNSDLAIMNIENDILRLELSDPISGLQKADILRQIWCDVLVDLKRDNSLSIQDALNAPHEFTFKGQTFQMSYQQVAAIKRQKHLELDLNESKGTVFSWFSSKTNKTLQSIPADLTLARI